MLKLSELKRLHDLGFSLLYLHQKQKRPIASSWTELPNQTWDEFKSEFNPKLNIGVRLGRHSKIGKKYLACIDVDVKEESARLPALAKLKELVGNERGFAEVRSGSGNGSRHLYCLTEKPFKMITIAKHPTWEICIYSTGRQMVLPPSVHPSGALYRWLNEEKLPALPTFDISEHEEIAEAKADERVLDFKAVDVDTSKLNPQMVKAIKSGDGVSDRSAMLLSVAMAMCRLHFTDNEILSVLSDPKNWISAAAYEHTQSNSRARAVKWLHKYTLKKARFETDIGRRFDDADIPLVPLSAEEAKKQVAEIEDDLDKKLPDLTKDHRPKATLRNLVHILESKHFMGGGLLGKNEFSQRIHFLRDTPYGGKAGRELTDQDDLELKLYLAKHYGFEPNKELCFEAHGSVAHKNRFHPVKTYLETLTWDKTPRLNGWLKSAFGANGPDEYLSAIGRKVLTAAVSRVFEPGCKFDHVMILEGPQGRGKSTALRMLASDKWFTDGLGDIQQKDVVDQMTGKWIIEMGELASIKKHDVETTKQFVSRQVDRVRMSYGRRSEDYPRQSIFVGSTNSEEYFSDETGNRRFWPVEINKADFKWIKKNRDQLWAEAVSLYQDCEELYLPEHLEAIANKEQAKRFVVDEWESEIKKLVGLTERDSGPQVKLTTTQVWRDITGASGDHPREYDCRRIGKVLRRIGFKRQAVRIEGQVTKGWVKSHV
jgi:predicted P-loop ATPase